MWLGVLTTFVMASNTGWQEAWAASGDDAIRGSIATPIATGSCRSLIFMRDVLPSLSKRRAAVANEPDGWSEIGLGLDCNFALPRQVL